MHYNFGATHLLLFPYIMELSLFLFFLTVPVLGCEEFGEGSVAVTAGDGDRVHGAGKFLPDVGSKRQCACGNVDGGQRGPGRGRASPG